MIQEDKELLLKDLCARLPYGVKILHTGWNYDGDTDFDTVETLIGIDDKFIYTTWDKTGDREKHCLSVSNWKPYLRPMSSMTKEEKSELAEMTITSPNLETAAVLFRERHYEEKPHWRNDWAICSLPKVLNWINAHHFDFRNLIDKGLAIDCTNLNIY